MITAHTKEALIGAPVGGEQAASGLGVWLSLTAAPTFAAMAAWTQFFSGDPHAICMAMQDTSPMSGMTMMYLLMGAFHLSPWLKLIPTGRFGADGNPGSASRRL